MAKGRFTFPVAILICLLLRIITGNEWQDVINLLVCALTAYLLIEINTAFTLIRTRSTLHVSFYVFLSTACLPVSAFLPVCRFCATHFSDRYFPIIQQLRISLSGGKYIPRFLFHRTGKPVVSTVALLCTSVLFGDDQFQIPVTQKFLCRTYRTLCALLALFRLCVLLRQNESLLSPFTGAYSFSTHQLWDIRDGQNHILWNHHLDITGQQRALFPCFLFRQGTHAYIPFFPDRR